MPPRVENKNFAADGLRKRYEAPSATVVDDTDQVYSWQDVAKHNSSASVWVIVGSKVYDLTSWVDKHPGGREVLLLMAGRDATAAFESYHPFSDKPRRMIGKFEIGKVNSYEFPQYKPDSGFYSIMNKRVNAYFKENNLNPKDPIPGMWRMLLVSICATLSFLACNNYWTNMFSIWTRALFAIIFGICQAMPLLHVMHDSSHTAFGTTENWWSFGGRLFMDFFAGANMTSWHYQHVVGHHIYTNVFQADPDLPVSNIGDPRRLVDRQNWTKMYKYQHLYLPPLYGILGLKFRIQDLTDTFFGKSNGPVRVNPISMYRWTEMWLSKIVWVCWRIAVPLKLFDISITQYALLFLLSEWITGYFLAFNFQVSHVSTECEYPLGEKNADAINDEWAVSQIKSSVDYGHGSWLTAFFSGALNYQVTHHLYPGVSQYHYPAIAPIIKKTCAEFNVEYKCLPNFFSAFYAHIKHLKNMGMKGIPAEVHMG
jgi:fatty acid desaturase